MGRRKLLTRPLFLILILVALLFLVSFVAGQKGNDHDHNNKTPGKAKDKAPVKTAKEQPKVEPKAAPKTEPKAAPKAEPKVAPKGGPKVVPKAKDDPTKDPAKGKEDGKGVKNPNPKAPPNEPTPEAPKPNQGDEPDVEDDNLDQQCYDCWTRNRSEIPACKGITEDDFTNFNKSPTSSKVATCLCKFADKVEAIFDDTCSAVCPDEATKDQIVVQAKKYKENFKCDADGNTILASNSKDLTKPSNQSSSSSISNNERNSYLVSCFVIGVISSFFLS